VCIKTHKLEFWEFEVVVVQLSIETYTLIFSRRSLPLRLVHNIMKPYRTIHFVVYRIQFVLITYKTNEMVGFCDIVRTTFTFIFIQDKLNE